MSNIEPLILALADVCAVTGQSKPVVHDAINAGDLETFLIGRRRFARIEAVKRWIDHLEEQSKAGNPVAYRSRDAQAAGRAA